MLTKAVESISSSTKSGYRKATYKDRSKVVKILCTSFRHDPHMDWLLAKCVNPDKLKIMMTYLFHKTMKIGKVYLSNDENAVALWKSEKKEQFTPDYMWRNLKFFLDIGLVSILRILKNERFTYKQYPKKEKYFHLYLIGVLPDYQGKGYASMLINPILETMLNNSIPVYPETANAKNVKIYERKGFKLYNTWFRPGIELYYMKKPIENS